MLVTKAEYDRRASSGFAWFRDTILFSKDDVGKDYRTKVQGLPPDEQERFLYEEFVRNNHPARIRAWITNTTDEALGITTDVGRALDDLLHPLGRAFKNDLALICESHHLDDLDDISKYKLAQPYGNSEQETANLQYAAVLLRTADLLHIASDRTPSILFRTLNPADPISQREWAKQMAVRSVRSQTARNDEGNADPDLQRNTIEVHASFTDEDGFFGLTSYLEYAERQIRKSHGWILQAQSKHASTHEFPWTRIDRSYIETEGFLQQQLEFTIDQAKILNLLTGHTLYNDASVVIRELVQNAIDAVRLQYFGENETASRMNGKIIVEWDSRTRKLSVSDNG